MYWQGRATGTLAYPIGHSISTEKTMRGERRQHITNVSSCNKQEFMHDFRWMD
jgi:hypothetical protein